MPEILNVKKVVQAAERSEVGLPARGRAQHTKKN